MVTFTIILWIISIIVTWFIARYFYLKDRKESFEKNEKTLKGINEISIKLDKLKSSWDIYKRKEVSHPSLNNIEPPLLNIEKVYDKYKQGSEEANISIPKIEISEATKKDFIMLKEMGAYFQKVIENSLSGDVIKVMNSVNKAFIDVAKNLENLNKETLRAVSSDIVVERTKKGLIFKYLSN